MQIHRIMGSSLRDALVRARYAHGDDAMVISQEVASTGAVTLAVARRASTQPEEQRPKPAQRPVHAALCEVADRLRAHGASDRFVERITTAVGARLDSGTHALDLAAEVIGTLYPRTSLPRLSHAAQVLAFVGSTGVGKTTSVIKLAWRLVHAGRRVELVTLDTQRVGAVEPLRSWAQQFAVPLTVLRPGVELSARAFQTSDIVLVDTAGRAEQDIEGVQSVSRAVTRAGSRLETYVVVPATLNGGALRAVGAAFAALQPTGSIVTKLDETREPAAVLEYVLHSGLPSAFLGDSADVASGFRRAEPDLFADLYLRGRMS